MLLTLALRNIGRSRARSLLTLSAIAAGCASIILAGGFIADTVRTITDSYIRQFVGHLRIYQEGHLEQGLTRPFDYLISDAAKVRTALLDVPHVRSVGPRLGFAGLVSTGDTTLSFIGEGIDPAAEPQLATDAQITSGQFLRSGETYHAVLGVGLANALSLKPGGSIVLVTNTRQGAINGADATVDGVFRTADKAFDDRIIRLPLELAQKLLRLDQAQTLVVQLDETDHTRSAQAAIQALIGREGWPLVVKRWDELEQADFVVKIGPFYDRIFLVLKLIILAVVTLSVFNTMNMAVLERIGEIGTLMAVGTRSARVMRLFLYEGLLLGFLGGFLGLALGVTGALVVSHVGIPMPSPPGSTVTWVARIAVVPSVLVGAFAQSVVMAGVSALWPAYKASRLEIGEALRHNL